MNGKSVLIGLTLAAVLVGLGVVIARPWVDDPFSAERAAAAFRRAQFWSVVWQAVWFLALIGLTFGLLGAIVAGVRWVHRMAGEIRPVDGVLPIQRSTMLAWRRGPRMLTYFHDPNRTAGPTTVYAALGVGDMLEVKQVPIEVVSPAQERITARAQAVQAVAALPREISTWGRGALPGMGKDDALPVDDGLVVTWPERVPARRFLNGPISIDGVPLGITVDERGQEREVRASMEDMVHLLVGGETGAGKSMLQSWMAWWLVMSGECDVCLVDVGRVTFTQFIDAPLYYPIANTPELAAELFANLNAEMERRLRLFEGHKGVDKLSKYNRLPGVEPLRPIVTLCDETSTLLSNKYIRGPMTRVLQMARKTGVWVEAGGTNFHATTMPTDLRVNFPTRIALRCDSNTSRVVLDGDASASKIAQVGRGKVKLPDGRGLVEVQFPFVEDRLFDQLPSGAYLHQFDGQRLPARDPVYDDFLVQIQDTWDAMSNPSITAVCRKLFGGQSGGRNWIEVKEAVDALGLSNHPDSSRLPVEE